MNRRLLFVAPLLALSLVASVSAVYVQQFGSTLANDKGDWGQFGDYFGGILNPLFALLAFLSALWSINVQQREARASGEELAKQTEIARKQFEDARAERVGEELLHVIRDIDGRLDGLLRTDISNAGTFPLVTISLMVAEAERVATMGGASPSFEQFIWAAREPGTLVEAPIREIRYLVLKLQTFLEQYSQHKATSAAPLVVYYADKAYRLLHMLEAVEELPPDTRKFFATVSDLHG